MLKIFYNIFRKLFERIIPVRFQIFLRNLKLKEQRLQTRDLIYQHGNELNKILDCHQKVENIFLFLPSLTWDLQIFQRPQQLAMALAENNNLVFYIQLPDIQNSIGIVPVKNNLYVCDLPVEIFNLIDDPIVYSLTWNYKYTRLLESPMILYDYIDEIDVFYGNKRMMEADHIQLVQKADWILATSVTLYEQIKKERVDVLLCPNGVDYDYFTKVKSIKLMQKPPRDITSIIEKDNPIIGYYGAIARWFDYDLMSNIAKKRKDLSFVLIGPDFDGTLLKSNILELENIHWLGIKAYSELPGYLSYFDIAIIPFKVNHITHATSPIKLFEYMTGGKPVVITPMRESSRYVGVLVADGVDQFSSRIDEGLILKDDNAYLASIDQVARENTWDLRANQILHAIRQTEES